MGIAQQADRKSTGWILTSLLLLASIIFVCGIQWGLPSRAADPFLFGNRVPWSGKEILALAPAWEDDASRAADVAAHPLIDRDKPIVVNQTNSERAAIVRRYRLYSDQPDEMITLRALAQMKPGKLQLDPKLYQYGGLWIYPIGALLKFASLFHLVILTPHLAFYLDHPEAFGRLYIVMRLYSATWGLLGVGVIYSLAKRVSQSGPLAATITVCYIFLPTVINAVHEAKPHLAGAVLGLIAVNFAIRAIEKGERKWVLACGIACGAAAGMVLTEWLVVGVIVAMAWLVPSRRAMTFVLAAFAAAATYVITNPYVLIHLLGDQTLLVSNLGNSANMYRGGAPVSQMSNGIVLLCIGGSVPILVGIVQIWRAVRARLAVGWILLAATFPGLCIFVVHSAGKPAEYARFALPMDLLWLVGIAVTVNAIRWTPRVATAASAMIALLLIQSAPYVMHYMSEVWKEPSRYVAARRISELTSPTIAIDAEPAPYCLPPVNLFERRLLLLPRNGPIPAEANVEVRATDYPGSSTPDHQVISDGWAPISWAGKPFVIQRRADAAVVEKAKD